jgi:hypothetical protein
MELKRLAEAHTGLEAESSFLQHSEYQMHDHQTVEFTGIPKITEIYISSMKKIVAVEYLSIAYRDVTNSVLAELCGKLAEKAFDVLDLKKAANITEIVCLTQLTQISTLEISGCWRITGKQISDCVLAMSGLQCLDASQCRLSAADFSNVANAIKNSDGLLELNLGNNKITRGALKTGKSGDFDSHYETDVAGVVALAGAVKSNGVLSKLKLSKNTIKGTAAGKAFAAMLAANTTLKELDFSGSSHMSQQDMLDVDCVQALSVGLATNTGLLKLDLSNNNIGERVPPEGWTLKYKVGSRRLFS